eukprot:TRINITY_DN3478_c0_g2_i2.p1 TRINITY_DN3478_c0_g2~~TRINITY_DN3478_c0_g2_i2.p1  ORF type:complete len:107 (+),score=4.01 TRINITY_DN3478_c0_g2_i2:203-523(+)
MKQVAKSVHVDIYSDFGCPWCYIGKKKFTIAKETYEKANPGSHITFALHPYIVHPELGPAGQDMTSYSLKKWGTTDRVQVFKSAGNKVGLAFNNWKYMPNTLLSSV